MKFDEKIINQLNEAIDILTSSYMDRKPFYEVTITDENGSRTVLESREEHLQTLIDVAIQEICNALEDIEDRNNRLDTLRVIK
ncbi:hypothetical protein [Metabacillus sp. Hm71]|uniref:hypothetical protein n=1 Tax=Metabacillus sp. Hm71 TaxID=3450743 RepID=UPI003F420967